MRLTVLLLVLTIAQSFGQTADSIQVKIHEGTNMAVAVSPDRSTLAIDLQGTLFSIPAAGGTAKALTDNLGDCRQPSWSPDGKTLVFQSYRDGGWHLWTIGADGRNLKQITFGIFDDREPHWSPDGKKIIFASDRNYNYDIWEMDLATETFKQLTKDPKNDYAPAYSPDGSSIAFISERDGKPAVYVKGSDGSESSLATAMTTAAGTSWSADGTKIVYYTSNGIETRLMMVDRSTKAVTDFTDPKEDAFPFRINWLSTGEVIYTADGQIKRRDAKKKITPINWEATVYLHRPPYKRKAYDFDSPNPRPAKGTMGPAVSPDGKQIVFGALGNLYLLYVGNPSPVQLTNNAYVNMHPSWSPDGKEIAFISDRDGSFDVFVHTVATGTARQMTKTIQNESFPAWSPDGKSIAFFQADGSSLLGGSVLHTVDVATGELKKVHGPVTTPSQPSWSPDGQHIVVSAMVPFSSKYREGLNKFLVMSLNGAPDKYIMPVEGRTTGSRLRNGPVWSPDGRMMAYIQEGLLWVLPVTPAGDIAAPPMRITNDLAECPTWAGDSKSIFYLSNDTFKRVSLKEGNQQVIPLDLTFRPQAAPTGRRIVHAGRLFDGRTNAYKTNVDIIVQGNRIREIIPHQDHGTAEVIDAGNQTVIPGMFDMHAHQSELEGEKTGRGWLAFGITSVREPGSDPYDGASRREIWSSGVRPGPRLFFTGYLQDGARVYYNIASSNSGANAELELGRAKAVDFDFMKTYVRMPDYMQKRFTAFAHANGMPISSHEIYPSTSYGVDAIEHIGATSRRGYSPVRSNIGRSYQDVTELMIKSRIFVTPTAALYGGFNILTMKDPTLFKTPQYVGIYSENYRTTYEGFVRASGADTAPSQAMLSGFKTTLNKLVANGIHFTAGTDSPFMPYGLSIQVEMQTYVEILGLSPYTALQSATIWAAESLGVDKDLGSIEAGKLADLVIVDGDPLKSIRDAMAVKTVMKNGLVYKVDELLQKPPVK